MVTATTLAYGMRKMLKAMNSITPSNRESTHWPVRNLKNVRFTRSPTRQASRATFSGRKAKSRVLNCARRASFPLSIYTASTRAMSALLRVPTAEIVSRSSASSRLPAPAVSFCAKADRSSSLRCSASSWLFSHWVSRPCCSSAASQPGIFSSVVLMMLEMEVINSGTTMTITRVKTRPTPSNVSTKATDRSKAGFTGRLALRAAAERPRSMAVIGTLRKKAITPPTSTGCT